jgi:hypothetical protein
MMVVEFGYSIHSIIGPMLIFSVNPAICRLKIYFCITPQSVFLEIFSVRKLTSQVDLAMFLCLLLSERM